MAYFVVRIYSFRFCAVLSILFLLGEKGVIGYNTHASEYNTTSIFICASYHRTCCFETDPKVSFYANLGAIFGNVSLAPRRFLPITAATVYATPRYENNPPTVTE